MIIRETDESVDFRIFVQPKASKNGFAGAHGDALKLRLTAPPVDGAANKMCISFLAKSFKVPKSSVLILNGESSRTKVIRVLLSDRASKQDIARKINEAM